MMQVSHETAAADRIALAASMQHAIRTEVGLLWASEPCLQRVSNVVWRVEGGGEQRSVFWSIYMTPSAALGLEAVMPMVLAEVRLSAGNFGLLQAANYGVHGRVKIVWRREPVCNWLKPHHAAKSQAGKWEISMRLAWIPGDAEQVNLEGCR